MNESKTMQQQSKPQEPKAPFPYETREVSYENKDAQITIAGTLTLPEGKTNVPAVLLISGMGPTDRDYSMLGHKRFLVLADYLTRHGIAALRVDKRGVGKTSGKFDTTLTCRDFADDVISGIEFLKTCKEINPKQIGLIGHSEGGLVATIVSAESKDVAFVVLMSGAISNSVESIIEQVAIQLQADGASKTMIEFDGLIRRQILNIIKHQEDANLAKQQIQKVFDHYWTQLPQAQKTESEKLFWAFSPKRIDALINFMNSNYYRFMLNYDSSKALAQIKIPLLAIYGKRDFMATRLVFPFIQKAMAESNNKNYKTIELPNLNHSLQTCKTGAMTEYATIEETIAPIALETTSDWILKQTINI